jgi:hypothetical protein
MSAQRPLTVEAARWQPVQQANGRVVWGRGAVGVPARQRRRRVEVVARPARRVIDDQAAGRGLGGQADAAAFRRGSGRAGG